MDQFQAHQPQWGRHNVPLPTAAKICLGVGISDGDTLTARCKP